MNVKKTNFLSEILDGPVPLRDLFESMSVGLIITDAENIICFYNKAQANRDGLKSQEVLGRVLTDVIKVEDKRAVFFSASAKPEPRTWQGFYTSPKGKAIEATLNRTPLVKGRQVIGAIYEVTTPNIADQVAPVEPLARVAPPDSRANVRQTKAGGLSSPRTARNSRPGTAIQGANCQGFEKIIGRSPAMQKAVKLAQTAALSPSPVMLTGETGTGKELFAKSIHDFSPRCGRRFVPINCAAIPPELLEGLLFGTTRGAFTGAADKTGLFEEADGGTIFLDELDSMPLKLQPKLLRFLQDRKIRRLGSASELEINVKIISAIGESSEEAVSKGRLRADLFYRLGVMIINLPPLRERPGDLPLLVDSFTQKFNALLGRSIHSVSPEVMEAFEAYGWPGNARELEHIIEAILNVAVEEREITLDMLPDHFSLSSRLTFGGYGHETLHEHSRYLTEEDNSGLTSFSLPTLHDREKDMISKALFITGGNVAKAAGLLDISRQLLVYKMKKHNLNRGNFKK